MSHFSVKVVDEKGNPAGDINIMIDYGRYGGIDENRTHSDGWVEFYNYGDMSGTIWVNGQNKGNHRLSNGKTYSYVI